MAKVVWISHRGLNQQHVENTQLAFDAAVAAGFVCLETDLRTTLDGHIVLHHDSSMKRTANSEKTIERITCKAFKQIQLIDGQCGMTFLEFVERYAALNWIFDIKPESGAKTLQVLKDWAKLNQTETRLLKQARFLLWQRDHEKLLRAYFPKAITLANQWECRRAGFAALLGMPSLGGIRENRCYAVPPRFFGQELFAESFFRAYHKRGARVLAYLPEKAEDIRRAQEAGADEILTNGKPIEI
ncbi:MAG: glycerophosphodiester phosphodiesterase [Oligoflexus sp.]